MRAARKTMQLAARALSLQGGSIAAAGSSAAVSQAPQAWSSAALSLLHRFGSMPAPAAAVLGSDEGQVQQREQPRVQQPEQQRTEQQQPQQQQEERQQQAAAAAAGAQGSSGAGGDAGAALGAPAKVQRIDRSRRPPGHRTGQNRPRRTGPAPLAALVHNGQKHRLVPVLLHYTGSCQDVVGLLRQFEPQGLSLRELTVACRRMGQLYTASLRARGRGAKPQPLTPQALAWLETANNHAHCREVLALAAPRVGEMDTQALAALIWMCGRFHTVPPAPLAEAWSDALWARREQLALVEMSNVMFSLGVLGWAPNGHLLDRLLQRTLDARAQLTPWILCNVLWGAARLADDDWHPGPDRVRSFVDASLPLLGAFTPESFCTLLFSLAMLRCRPDDASLVAILDQFEWQVAHSINRHLVTAVWAMGALQLGNLVTERLWESIEATVSQQADDFNFCSASLFLFGAARMQLHPSEPVLELMLRRTRDFLPQLRTGDVAIVLWALAKLGHRAGQGAVTHDLLATLLERFFYHDEHAAPASLRHISAIIWACANLKYPIEPAQLSRLIRRAEAALERAGAQAQLSTVDANMMLTAFEALESAEGLQFLKRQLIGGAVRRGGGGTITAAPGGEDAPEENLLWEDVLPKGAL